MFGYATDETKELMPLSIVLAHKLNRRLADCRRNNTLDWINPDSKTQVIHPIISTHGYLYFPPYVPKHKFKGWA